MDNYLRDLMLYLGADYAFRVLNIDLRAGWENLTAQGRTKALAALIGFASR